MDGKVPTPVDGDDNRKGAPDGVSGVPGREKGTGVNGRSASGETGGGAYPNPHDDTSGHSMDHGGQSEMKYYGGGQAGGGGSAAPNSPAGSNEADADADGKLAPPAVEREPRTIHAGGRSFDVVEDSGVAAAEAAGRVKPAGSDEPKDTSKLAG